MQMQDDVIGTNTGNNASFGSLSNIRMAGRYVICTIAAVVRSGGALTRIDLTAAPTATFNFGANASVQAITYELFGNGGDYSTTANMTALPWDGSIGGVLAFQVDGRLTLRHALNVNGLGFRGGAATQGGGAGCDASTYIASNTSTTMAEKGEGIYRISSNSYRRARGRALNGGGGGNSHNAGGGGGGGFTSGGNGGPGYGCSTAAGGLGGLALSGSIGASRVFLGGGGGGGEGNNNQASAGARGGGIILIHAERLRVQSGTCASASISASGSNSPNAAGGDGAGGGGGGGSIIIDVEQISVPSGCNLIVSANGGNGGTVAHGDVHGGGGGGGQGAVVLTIAIPNRMTVQTNNGTGGCSNNANPCTSRAGSGAGTAGAGIFTGTSTPLPVELLGFTAHAMGREVRTEWATATEQNSDRFLVERSSDLVEWNTAGEVAGAGYSTAHIDYAFVDGAPLGGLSYYRLRQVDFDGAFSLSDVVAVRIEGDAMAVTLHPNPSTGRCLIRTTEGGDGTLEVYDALGRSVLVGGRLIDGRAELDLEHAPAGTYVVVVRTPAGVRTERLMLRP